MMSREIAGVEPCLDFAHLHARTGDGSMNSYPEWMRTLEAYANALGEAALKGLHCHISGIEYTVKGEKEHLPLRDSDLDLSAILQALKDMGCAGRILCESPILEEDALFAKQCWMEVSGES
jgi:deoxyribonuclease-4